MQERHQIKESTLSKSLQRHQGNVIWYLVRVFFFKLQIKLTRACLFLFVVGD